MQLIFDKILEIFSEVWMLCVEMAPYLLLGMLVSGLISIFITKDMVLKQIGSKDFKSILKSTLFGIPLPLCSCGVIPVAATLRESGASKGSTASFLVSTPQTGIDSIFLTYGMLGPVFALFRPIAAFFSGIFSGMIINTLDDEKHHHIPNTKSKSNRESSLKDRMFSGIKYGFLTLPADIVVPLCQGLVVAAAISVFLPPDLIADTFSENSFAIYVMMLLVSLPIYVCATASIPIAVALMAEQGITAGAVFVFLMAGPATNASSIAVIKNILGKKTLYYYVSLIAFTSVLFGVVLDTFVIVGSIDHSSLVHDHHGHGILPMLFTILFIGILANSYFYKDKESASMDIKGKRELTTSDQDLAFTVNGMTCSHCKESVESAIFSFDAVRDTTVDLATGGVIISGIDLDENAIKEKISSRGFTTT